MKAMMVFGDDCCCFVLQFVSRCACAFRFTLTLCAEFVSPVAGVCAFLVSRLAFVCLQFVSRCAYFTIELLCVSRLTWHLLTLCAEFVSPVIPGRVCVSRFAFALCFTLACAEVVSPVAPGRVSCFAFRVSRDVSLWHLWRHLLFVSRCAYFRISYHNGVVERAIESVMRFSSHLVAFVAFVFRVSCFALCFTLAFVAIFSRYAYVFLVSFWHFDDDQKLYMDFFKMVCKMLCKDGSCARCCAKWCARFYAR